MIIGNKLSVQKVPKLGAKGTKQIFHTLQICLELTKRKETVQIKWKILKK